MQQRTETHVERYPLFTAGFRSLLFNYQSLGIILEGNSVNPLLNVLNEGIVVPIALDPSIHSWLTEDICLTERYVRSRVLSVLLNGRPIKDTRNTIIHNRDTLTLSSDAPRLSGTIVRSGRRLAGFRWRAGHRGLERRKGDGLAMVDVRVIGSLAEELGPPLLARGVLLRGKRLAAALPPTGDPFWAGCRSLRLNRLGTDPKTLRQVLQTESERSFIFRLLSP